MAPRPHTMNISYRELTVEGLREVRSNFLHLGNEKNYTLCEGGPSLALDEWKELAKLGLIAYVDVQRTNCGKVSCSQF